MTWCQVCCAEAAGHLVSYFQAFVKIGCTNYEKDFRGGLSHFMENNGEIYDLYFVTYTVCLRMGNKASPLSEKCTRVC